MNDTTVKEQLDRVAAAAAGYMVTLEELVRAAEFLAFCANYGVRPHEIIKQGVADCGVTHKDITERYYDVFGNGTICYVIVGEQCADEDVNRE